MPKLIDYPRTSYTSAWEVAEVVDDTGGKCALETCARKLNRKVSGSFKAIVGSAVKFGLLTSKRELLTTTTLFRRIKHAYDKQEELLFHREAFLTPALFAQICRKFRLRELPVAMLDVLLIREFDVEEINAQSVAKGFVDGARMVGILDEHNVVADIDQLSARQSPRRELANPAPASNTFRGQPDSSTVSADASTKGTIATTGTPGNSLATTTDTSNTRRASFSEEPEPATPTRTTPAPAVITTAGGLTLPPSRLAPTATSDAIATLFGITSTNQEDTNSTTTPTRPVTPPSGADISLPAQTSLAAPTTLFRLQISGPGVSTDLEVTDADDLTLVRALLDKIERQLRRGPN